MEAARERIGENPLRNALATFYLQPGIQTGSVEFAHKSFSEFLFAKRLKESLENWTEVKRRARGFYIPQATMDEEIYDLLGYGGLTPEVVEYLMSLVTASDEFRPIPLFQRLEDFYQRWCQGEFIDAHIKTLPHEKSRQLHEQNIELGQRQVDIYAGLNVMILLLELNRYAQKKDDLKEQIVFYPSGRSENNRLNAQLLHVINYSDVIEISYFNNLVKRYLSGANLSHANLSGVNLSGANLSRANLSGANLSGAKLNGIDLSGANLSYANLSRASLSGASLSGANLNSAYLICAELSGAKLSRAYLSRAKLNGIDLSGANLSCAELTHTELSGANLTNTNLSCADLSRANISRANLSGVDLSGAYLICAELSCASLSRANLSYANLSRANLSYANLSRADLTDANLSYTNFTDANFSRADLSGANFRDANLTDANLTDTNLSGAYLSDTCLTDTNLSGAYLSGTYLSYAELILANVKNARFRNNLGISEKIKLDLIQRGAIFEDSPGDGLADDFKSSD